MLATGGTILPGDLTLTIRHNDEYLLGPETTARFRKFFDSEIEATGGRITIVYQSDVHTRAAWSALADACSTWLDDRGLL